MLTLDSDRPCLLLTGDMSRLAEFWRRALRLSVGRERNDRVELVDDDRRAQIIVRQVMPPRPRVRVTPARTSRHLRSRRVGRR